VPLRRCAHYWIFGGRGVIGYGRRPAVRRADGAVTDGLDAVRLQNRKNSGCWKMRVQFHLVDRGLDARVAENKLQFGDGHVGGADVARQAHVDQSPPS